MPTDALQMDIDKANSQSLDTSGSRPAFVPLPETSSGSYSRATGASSEDIKLRAKALEPAAGSIINIPHGVSIKILRNRLCNTVEEDKADEISERARLSPESAKAAKEALARIAARRNWNDDLLDGSILTGVAVEMAHGFWSCLQAIKALEKRDLAVKAKEDKK